MENKSEAMPGGVYAGLWNQNHTASVRAALQKISYKFPVGTSKIIIEIKKDDAANVYVKSFVVGGIDGQIAK